MDVPIWRRWVESRVSSNRSKSRWRRGGTWFQESDLEGERRWENDLERKLRFQEEERETFGLVEGRRRRVGSAQGEISNKKRAPEGFSHYYKFTLGSTLGVDSWYRKIQTNDGIILKKFETLREGCLPKY